MKHQTPWPLFVMASALALTLSWTPLGAQQQPPQQDRQAAARKEFRIFALKHADAAEVATVINSMFGREPRRGGFNTPNNPNVVTDLQVAVDHRTNSLLVRGSPADLEIVEALTQRLDLDGGAAPNKERPSRVVTFPLRNITPDESLDRVLAVVMQAPNATFAVDRLRKAVVLSGEPDVLETARRLLTELDAPAAEKPALAEMRIRLTWLIAGNRPEGASNPPPDMGDVLAELAKLGIEKPWLAAQCLINATPNQAFQIDGTAKLDAPCQLVINGTLSEGRQQPRLQIEIGAMKLFTTQPPRGDQFLGNAPARQSRAGLCNLRTEITTPIGQSIVLGVTPTDGMTSVFVVQVLRK